MSYPKPPCKGCQERGPGCHASCEKYKTWAADREREREEKFQAQALENRATSFALEGRRKAIKKMGSRKAKKFKS